MKVANRRSVGREGWVGTRGGAEGSGETWIWWGGGMARCCSTEDDVLALMLRVSVRPDDLEGHGDGFMEDKWIN
jgi:hypothetical protein